MGGTGECDDHSFTEWNVGVVPGGDAGGTGGRGGSLAVVARRAAGLGLSLLFLFVTASFATSASVPGFAGVAGWSVAI